MRESYFRTEERIDRLEKELESWLGTPFKHNNGLKGVAADCIHHVAIALYNVGAIKKYNIKPYGKDWHMHKGHQRLFKNFVDQAEAQGRSVEIFDPATSEPEDGDIVLYQFGNFNMSHSSVYCRGFGYHSLTDSVNMRIPYGDEISKGSQKKVILRITEEVGD